MNETVTNETATNGDGTKTKLEMCREILNEMGRDATISQVIEQVRERYDIEVSGKTVQKAKRPLRAASRPTAREEPVKPEQIEPVQKPHVNSEPVEPEPEPVQRTHVNNSRVSEPHGPALPPKVPTVMEFVDSILKVKALAIELGGIDKLDEYVQATKKMLQA